MARYQLMEHRSNNQSIAWVKDTSDGLYSLSLHEGDEWATTDEDGHRIVDIAAVESGSWDCIYTADELGILPSDDLDILHEWDA